MVDRVTWIFDLSASTRVELRSVGVYVRMFSPVVVEIST